MNLVGIAAIVASLALVDEAPTLLGGACAAVLIGLGNLPIVHLRHGSDNHTFNWSEAGIIGGLVLLPAWWLPLVGTAVTAIWYALGRHDRTKVLFNAATFAAGGFLVTAIHSAVIDALGTSSEWAALAFAGAAWFVWSTSTVAVAVALSRRVGVLEVASSGLLLALIFAVANTSVAILVATTATSEPVVLFAVPPVVLQLLVAYRNTREVIGERDLWVSVQSVVEELQRAGAEDLPATVIRTVERLVEAAAVELITVDGGSARRYQAVDGNLRCDSGPVDELASDVWGQAGLDGGPFWLLRPTAPPSQRTWLDQVGAVGAIVIPLESSGVVLGLLRVAFRHRRGNRRMESVLTTVATQIASALASHRHTESLRHQAEHDELTDLPNRHRLVQHLDGLLAEPAADGSSLAVLFFDLDGFKVVNDSLGHHVGDRLLLDAADRLRSRMRQGDIVARFGGDEFIVVCRNVHDPAQAMTISRRLLEALAGPGGNDDSVPISASVGVAFAEAGTDADADTLLRDADAAMYQAKRTGPGSTCLFTAELRAQVLNRMHLEADLRDALRDDELEVHYQPIVDLRTGAVHELEVLARWQHPERGSVPPEAFISVAEQSGHIRALGGFVLNRACADMRRWLDLGIVAPGQRVSVNLSPMQLDASLPTVVGETLARHGLPASALTLEVTESAFVDDPDGVASLERLRAIGVRVALDDFGTGYSSLSALRDLPADVVKIDRSFIERVSEDSQLGALVKGIVDLAHALELQVVAEGVETVEQSAVLESFGCDLAQGWLHGRPVSPAVAEALLAEAWPSRPTPGPHRTGTRNLRLA